MESPFFTTEMAAAYLCLSPKTLERYRVVGGGPAYHKIGRRVLYHRDDLQAWIEARRRESTSEAGR